MSEELGKLFIDVKVDQQKLKASMSKLTKTTEQASAKINRQFSAAFTSLTRIAKRAAIGAGIAIAAIGVYSIKAAADAEETANRFDQLFLRMKKQANKTAASIGKAFQRSDTTIKDAMSGFQGLASNMEISDSKALGFSKTLTELALDFASFNNISDAEAFQRFIAAMSGSSEVVEKYGIDLKQANLEQELISSGLAKSAKAATETQKKMARLQIIYKSMGRQGAIGDAIRTSGSLTNQLKLLKENAKTVSETLGKTLLPVVNKYTTELNKWIDDNDDKIEQWAKNIGDNVEKVIDWFDDFIVKIGGLVVVFKALNIVIKIFVGLLITNFIVTSAKAILSIAAFGVALAVQTGLIWKNRKALKAAQKAFKTTQEAFKTAFIGSGATRKSLWQPPKPGIWKTMISGVTKFAVAIKVALLGITAIGAAIAVIVAGIIALGVIALKIRKWKKVISKHKNMSDQDIVDRASRTGELSKKYKDFIKTDKYKDRVNLQQTNFGSEKKKLKAWDNYYKKYKIKQYSETAKKAAETNKNTEIEAAKKTAAKKLQILKDQKAEEKKIADEQRRKELEASLELLNKKTTQFREYFNNAFSFFETLFDYQNKLITVSTSGIESQISRRSLSESYSKGLTPGEKQIYSQLQRITSSIDHQNTERDQLESTLK